MGLLATMIATRLASIAAGDLPTLIVRMVDTALRLAAAWT